MVLAGLLRGQLSNQQRLHELAHEIKVTVEGEEGILGRQGAGGEWETSEPGRAGLTSSSPCPQLDTDQSLPGPGPKHSLCLILADPFGAWPHRRYPWVSTLSSLRVYADTQDASGGVGKMYPCREMHGWAGHPANHPTHHPVHMAYSKSTGLESATAERTCLEEHVKPKQTQN